MFDEPDDWFEHASVMDAPKRLGHNVSAAATHILGPLRHTMEPPFIVYVRIAKSMGRTKIKKMCQKAKTSRKNIKAAKGRPIQVRKVEEAA